MSYIAQGSEFLVNQITALNQTGVRVAALGPDRFIVTWGSDAASANSADIIGRIFDSNGNPIGGEFTINSNLAEHQATQDVVTLANGNFVVTWVDYDSTQDGDNTSIKARLFDANGAALGSEFLINLAGAGRQDSAEVAALDNGGFVVTWDDWTSTDMMGRIYDAAGLAATGDVRLNTNTTGRQEYGEVVGLANGSFLALWRTTDPLADGSGDAVKGQVFDATGAKLGSEFRVNTAVTGSQNAPAVSVLADGNFVVTWTTSDTFADGNGSAIKAQLFSADAVKIGAEFLVNTQAFGTQNGPTITALADGGYFIAWYTSDTAQDGSSSAVKGQFFAADNTRVGGEVLLNSVAAGSQSQPSIAATSDGAIIVTWVSSLDGFTDRNVKAQIIRPNAAPVITSDGGESGAAVTVVEGATGVTAVAATDGNSPQTLTYSIAGGADAALFTIDTATGALRFLAAPDFEAPVDADGDNAYDVVVSVSDGELSDSQAIVVSVANANEAVTITSPATYALLENTLAVGVVAASDADGDAVSFTITGGADAVLFAIDAATGALSFLTGPDFEAPADADGNNVYEVIVSASDGDLSDSRTIAVSVGNSIDGVTINGSASSNTINGTVAEDMLYGNGGSDVLLGGNGDDLLSGGTGNDKLTGGEGADLLSGGSGADQFIFRSATESALADMDVILDFTASQSDRINLGVIDANALAANNQAFKFIGTAAFGNVAGQLRYEHVNGATFVYGDTNGDAVADFGIQLEGMIGLAASNFVL